MANLDSLNAEPLYDMGAEVMQKGLGIGRVDQRSIRQDGVYYHVAFNNGNSAWIPECDLKKAPKVARK